MKKDSFVLYTEFSPSISRLSDESCGKLFKMIMTYAEGEIPEMKGVKDTEKMTVSVLFGLITNRMDRDAERYEAVVEARRRAGKESGRARRKEGK